MYKLELSKEEFMALWELLFQRNEKGNSYLEGEREAGFESLKEKIKRGPLYAVWIPSTAP